MAGSRSMRVVLDRPRCSSAGVCASAAEEASRLPLRFISRVRVDGSRPSRLAIERADSSAATPNLIWTRSDNDNASPGMLRTSTGRGYGCTGIMPDPLYRPVGLAL